MGALTDAQRHLGKAREFLDSAVDELDFERFNAATSSATVRWRPTGRDVVNHQEWSWTPHDAHEPAMGRPTTLFRLSVLGRSSLDRTSNPFVKVR